MILLSADWHLDDQPANEYRWQVFDHVRAACAQYGIKQTFILGDLVDRKDRFSAAFVNRLLAALQGIAPVTILRGNHDTALRPPHYFDWLSQNSELVAAEIYYITQPTVYRDLLLLPFTPKPADDWQGLPLADHQAIFMHATVTGAVIDHGIILENPTFPPLPRHSRVYSGDIHHPQQVGVVTYVGAPHAVKFGDDYATRMLVLDPANFEIAHELALDPPRKLMVGLRHLGDLARIKVRPGDQVRLRLQGMGDDLAAAEAEIAQWAQAHGVTVAGTEVIVTTSQAHGVDTTQSPEAILRQFAAHEGLAEDVLAVGLELLKGTDQ